MTARKRNIMRRFRIDEISAVDRPAQEAAKVAILKRDGRPVEESEQRTDSTYFVDSPELHALAERLEKAAAQREAREQEIMTMSKATADNDDHVAFRKLADDAERNMRSYIAKRGRNTSRTAAAEQWRRDNPTEFEALNRVAPSAPAPVTKRRGEATVGFMKLVDQIVERDHCPRHVAMEIARKADPSAFAKLQASA